MAELMVNTAALCSNYRHYAAAGTVIPVLKNNGYALDAAKLRRLLEQQGAGLFACATPEEALALAGSESDLLLLSCVHDGALLQALVERGVILTVESLAQARQIDALGLAARVHLAVDTGFGRFGFQPEETEAMRQVFALQSLRVEGIFSHFRGADAAPEQFARFGRVLLALDDCPVGLRHIAATRTAEEPQFRLDAVRIGSGLTGCRDGAPVAVLQAEVCAVRRLKKGDRVGYGDTLLRRDTELAVLNVGTADGAFVYRNRGLRAFWHQRRPYVTFRGRTAAVLCPPGLTHTMVDVTGLDCRCGDRAEVPCDLMLVSAHVPRGYV